MATITAGNSQTITLNGDRYVTITTQPNTEGSFSVTPIGTGSIKTTQTGGRFGPPAVSSRQLGPYGVPVTMVISCVTGSVDYSISTGPGAAVNVLPAGCVQTLRTHGQAGVSVGAAFTFSMAAMLEGDYDAVRFCFANYGATTWTITGAKTVAAPSVSDNGSGLTWSNITFDKAASAQAGDVWDGTTGSTNTYVMPAAVVDSGSNSVPTLVWSDWVPQTSVACTDTGSTDLRVTQMRVYSASTGYKVMQAGSSATNYGDYNTNSRRKIYGLLTAGDKVTTTSAVTNIASWQWSACVAVQGLLRKPIYNHGIFGDSISKGQGSYDNNNGLWGWAHRAPQGLTDAGIGVHSVANYACSGQGKAATWSTFLQVIQQRGLDTATMFPWSPNDGEAALQSFRFQVYAFIAACQKNDVKPILCTQPPAAQITTTVNDAIRVAINQEIRSMTAYGATICDFDAVLSDGAALARFISGLSNGDNIHPSAAGHAAMDAVYRGAIRAALQI